MTRRISPVEGDRVVAREYAMHSRRKILAGLANSAVAFNAECNAGRCIGREGRRATNGEAIVQACRWVFYVVLVVQREGVVAWMPGGV